MQATGRCLQGRGIPVRTGWMASSHLKGETRRSARIKSSPTIRILNRKTSAPASLTPPELRAATRHSAEGGGSGCALEKRRDGTQDRSYLLRAQLTDFLDHQRFVRRENFPRPHIARQLQTSARKIGPVQPDGPRVCLRFAGDLAEDPITAPGVSKHEGWPDLALREIRERKRNENYRTRCRCCHAVSSSGLFQSSAKAASLSRAHSPAPLAASSGMIMTKARWLRSNCTGFASFTEPCSSISASSV